MPGDVQIPSQTPNVATGELKLSDRFHRAKRNLFWSASVLIVVACARPKDLKLPGLGDSTLGLRVGLFLLFIGVVYAFVEYWTEFQIAKIHHSQAVMEKDSDEIGHLFERQKVALANVEAAAIGVVQHYGLIFDASSSMREAVSDREDRLRDSLRIEFDNLGIFMPLLNLISAEVNRTLRRDINAMNESVIAQLRPISEIAGPSGWLGQIEELLAQYPDSVAEPTVSELSGPLNRELASIRDRLTSKVFAEPQSPIAQWSGEIAFLEQQGQPIMVQAGLLAKEISQYQPLQEALSRDFQRLSRSLHTAHRVSFTLLDTWVPRVICAAAVIAFFGALLFGKGGLLVYDPGPPAKPMVHLANGA